MALDNRRHLHSDAGSIVEVFQHVLALGVFEQGASAVVQGEATGPTI